MVDGCVFCHFDDKDVLLHDDGLCYAIISKNPINKYHVLIIPKHHYRQFIELPDDLASHLFLVAKRISEAVRKVSGCDAITHLFDDDIAQQGYNLVPHFKFHIIPRFKKDLPMINWSPLRSSENDDVRKTYAKELKDVLNVSD